MTAATLVTNIVIRDSFLPPPPIPAPRGWIARARMLWRLRREFDADLTPFRGQSNAVVHRALIRELLPGVRARMIRDMGKRMERELLGIGFGAAAAMDGFGAAIADLADELGKWTNRS